MGVSRVLSTFWCHGLMDDHITFPSKSIPAKWAQFPAKWTQFPAKWAQISKVADHTKLNIYSRSSECFFPVCSVFWGFVALFVSAIFLVSNEGPGWYLSIVNDMAMPWIVAFIHPLLAPLNIPRTDPSILASRVVDAKKIIDTSQDIRSPASIKSKQTNHIHYPRYQQSQSVKRMLVPRTRHGQVLSSVLTKMSQSFASYCAQVSLAWGLTGASGSSLSAVFNLETQFQSFKAQETAAPMAVLAVPLLWACQARCSFLLLLSQIPIDRQALWTVSFRCCPHGWYRSVQSQRGDACRGAPLDRAWKTLGHRSHERHAISKQMTSLYIR